MKRTLVTLAATLALTGAAFAVESNTGPGASGNAPGRQMQENGSKAGSPGASGYAPGQEMKSGTTGSTGSTGSMGGSTGGTTMKGGNNASGAGTSGSGSSSR